MWHFISAITCQSFKEFPFAEFENDEFKNRFRTSRTSFIMCFLVFPEIQLNPGVRDREVIKDMRDIGD